jgi:hypothetical protein
MSEGRVANRGRRLYAPGMSDIAAHVAPPLTIADLRSQGLAGLWVTCSRPMCLHGAAKTFEAVGADNSDTVYSLARKGFACSSCGSREVTVQPDWRCHDADGNGR